MKYSCLPLFVILWACFALPAFCSTSYQDGQLCLEVNLLTDKQINIKQQNSAARLLISEMDGLISKELGSDLQLSVVTPETLSYFAIQEFSEIVDNVALNFNGVDRAYFAWQDSLLLIKHELLHFLPDSYSLRSEAEAFARQQGIPYSRIMEIPVINSTIKVQQANGETLYLETPLKLSSSAEIILGNQKIGFSGDFIIKTVKGKIVFNQYLPLENYLAGVIQNEIGNNSPLEALKAQAVAARTHALSLLLNNRHKADGYDLCSGTHCQVYKGKYLQNSIIQQAIMDCANEVLLIDGRVADATYHSSCGGKTDSSAAIWKGKPLAHLNGVTCMAEADSLDLSDEAMARKWIDSSVNLKGMSSWERATLNWDKSISLKQLANNVGLSDIKRIEIIRRGRSGRILSIKLEGNRDLVLDNEYKIRQAFGNLLSSFFYIKGTYQADGNRAFIYPKASLQIKGKGAGHGVGMCQVGTLRMAREGSNYREILFQYYPGTTINKDWNHE